MQNHRDDNKTEGRYRANLVAYMNYTNGTDFPATTSFSNEDLFLLTPESIYAYMANKVYGTPTPNYTTDNPTEGRSGTLEFAKKSISYFMPNRLMPWNAETNAGNPTRSIPVNNLIKQVKKQEVRKQGRKSCARRPMDISEFKAVIETFRGSHLPLAKHTLAAYFIFQYNLMARVDDVAKFKMEDLTASVDYPFTL